MRHSLFHGLLLTLLILLPAADLTAQEEGPHFVVEEALGEVAVWKVDPATGETEVAPLPAGVSREQLEGASVAPAVQPPTLLSGEGDPLLLYNEDQFLVVEESGNPSRFLVRLQDGQWVHWLDGEQGWEPYGPPPGEPDAESWMVQDFLNRHLKQYHLHYTVVMRPDPAAPPPISFAGDRRFWLAYSVMPAVEDPLHVLLLIELNDDDEIARVILLGDDSGLFADPRVRGLRASEVTTGLIYDAATGSIEMQEITTARVGREILYLFDESGRRFTMRSDVEEWPVSAFARVGNRRSNARIYDLERAQTLERETVINQTQSGAFQDLNYRGFFDLSSDTNGECPEEPPGWIESRTNTFSLIYLSAGSDVGRTLVSRFGETLEQDYTHYRRLFDASLPLPINIRIYPDRRLYHCLNPVAPELPPARFHDRVGNREIVLIGGELNLQRSAWYAQVLAALRYELVSFFAEEITGGKAPPGLMGGLALYAQEPDLVLAGRRSDELRPDWDSLWAEPAAVANKAVAARAMTPIAYLVDAHGWPAFRQFLTQLATEAGYREALFDTYGVPPSTLMAEWQRYDPLYVEDRWRANVFHGFDFTRYEQLLAAGAYEDAAKGLQEAITFLESVEDGQRLSYARQLLEEAQKGERAGALLVQARQALQTREYTETIALTDDAAALYDELEDARRLDELQAYRSRAEEALALKQELVHLQEDAAGADQAQLLSVARRLAEFGDDSGLALVEAQRKEREAQQGDTLMEAVNQVLLLMVALVALRLLLVRLGKAPESRLL